ncbi:MAG: tRNA pseudouridine(55) synthase TruB [Deltaproteobacteria bacterium]|nr:tRNA pseudouridine(55) synthase TruB [Deltaproteobacteria bacterium]
MHGVCVVDKPRGPTCQKVLNLFKRKFGKIKIGHSGTLDPFATGVLPIFLGNATRLIPFIQENEKTYEATLQLGVKTDTFDDLGEILEERVVPHLTSEQIRKVFEKFLGKQQQIPPLFSAVKIAGVPLYKKARRGESVELKPRDVQIHSIELIQFNLSQIQFRTCVSKGTYIRRLAVDIAEQLGTIGHLIQLKRIQTGPFDLKSVLTFSKDLQLEASKAEIKMHSLKTLARLTQDRKWYDFESEEAVLKHKQGQLISSSNLQVQGSQVWTRWKNEFVSVSEVIQEIGKEELLLKPLRLIELELGCG